MLKYLPLMLGVTVFATGTYLCVGTQTSVAVYFFPMLFGVFITVGGAFVLWISNEEKTRSRNLEERGRWVEAEVLKIEKEDEALSDDQATFRLVAVWKDVAEGRTYGLVAEELTENPAPYIRNNQIEVLVDEQDATNYAINWSFLPDKD